MNAHTSSYFAGHLLAFRHALGSYVASFLINSWSKEIQISVMADPHRGVEEVFFLCSHRLISAYNTAEIGWIAGLVFHELILSHQAVE